MRVSAVFCGSAYVAPVLVRAVGGRSMLLPFVETAARLPRGVTIVGDAGRFLCRSRGGRVGSGAAGSGNSSASVRDPRGPEILELRELGEEVLV